MKKKSIKFLTRLMYCEENKVVLFLKNGQGNKRIRSVDKK